MFLPELIWVFWS